MARERPENPIIVALDGMTIKHAMELVNDLNGLGCCFKVNDLLTDIDGGTRYIPKLNESGFVMADPKFYDIPNTMKNHIVKISAGKPKFVTIHACNTIAALEAAADAAKNTNMQLLGVTVLTTYDSDECISVFGGDVEAKVKQFAGNAQSVGIPGIVCSPKEAQMLREIAGFDDTILVTPGIRPRWAAADDQKRITTPADAIKNGSDYLVIGRPITKAAQYKRTPKQAVKDILEEIG